MQSLIVSVHHFTVRIVMSNYKNQVGELTDLVGA